MCRISGIGRPKSQESTLFGPRGGDWLESLQISRRERDRLTAVEDRFDNVGGEKCQREDPAHLAIVYPGMNRNFGRRLRSSSRKLLEPNMSL